MRYVSTRSRNLEVEAGDVLLGALAPDGGLYLPADWPVLTDEEGEAIAGGDYRDALVTVAARFLDGDSAVRMKADPAFADRALARFRHPVVAPLTELDRNTWLLELFHGPTLSFKDYGLQPLARLARDILGLGAEDPRLIIGATSGDTGSAALAAFAGIPGVTAVMLFPEGRISSVQRRQMTTLPDPNVHCIAIAGSFDDAQRLAKAALQRLAATGVPVLAVNSINWGRILFQSVYYQWTARRLAHRAGRAVRFVIPSGNFGNAFAAILAWRMGAPIAGLLLATNNNDALVHALHDGRLRRGDVVPTLSPAMDIQVPSNFERLLALLLADPAATAAVMARFAAEGQVRLPLRPGAAFPLHLTAIAIDDDTTLATIRDVYGRTDRLLCPHTAVGYAARQRAGAREDVIDVLVATAHPAKFPQAIARAVGCEPLMPPVLAEAMTGTERVSRLPPDEEQLMRYLAPLLPACADS